MKPEKMQEIIDKKANGYEDIKPKGVSSLTESIHVFTKLVTIVVILAFVAVCIYMIFLMMPRIILFTGTDKEKFIKELEARYHRNFEIVQDNTVSRRGTGTYILRTTKEPIIEFNAEKEIEGNYKTDFEENLIKYYYENPEYKGFFEGTKLETGFTESVMNKGFYFLTCKIYIDIDNYSQIEETTKKAMKIMQLYRIQISNFGNTPKIRKGDYVSSVYYDSENSEEQQIYEEEYEYYWYAQTNNKDLSDIPTEDIENFKTPKELTIFIDGKQAKGRDKIGEENLPAKALFNKQTREYSVNVVEIVTNTEQVKLLNDKINTNLKFKYNGKEYEIQYKDNEVHGNKLPPTITINELQEIFGARIQYYYTKARVEIWFDN